MRRTVIVDGFRTAFCKESTLFKDVRPDFLGALVVREMVSRLKNWGLKESVIDFVLGVTVANSYPNIARIMAYKGGVHAPADTLNKNCGSGIAAVHYADVFIKHGYRDTVLVVGIESMSKLPFMYSDELKASFIKLARARSKKESVKLFLSLMSKQLRPQVKEYKPIIGLKEGLTDPICDMIMGLTAEGLAKDPSFGITRESQDAFSCRSHNLSERAQDKLEEEIVPVVVPVKRGTEFVDSDNGIRAGQTMDALKKLKPVFDPRYGSVTVGNSSQVTDGAAAILLMVEEKAKSLNLPILGYVGEYEDFAFDPTRMGLAPVGALAKLLQKTGRTLKDFSVLELNEAFAAQVLACVRTIESDTLMKKLFGDRGFEKRLGEIEDKNFNPNGGAIALGHPVGVSGMRLIITALKEIWRRNSDEAAVGACIGGGQANFMRVYRR